MSKLINVTVEVSEVFTDAVDEIVHRNRGYHPTSDQMDDFVRSNLDIAADGFARKYFLGEGIAEFEKIVLDHFEE